MAKTVKKNLRIKRQNKQQSKSNIVVIVLIGVAIAFFIVVIGFFMKEADRMASQENYDYVGTDSRCPSVIELNGKQYNHLKQYDTIRKKNQGYESCGFDILSCIYGRECSEKTLNDGKKLGKMWQKSPACGREHYNKTFEFCNKDDLVAVHLNIEQKNNPVVWAGQTTYLNPNACINKYGVSADKSFNNANLGMGVDGFVGSKECWGTSDLSKFKKIA